MAKTRAQKRSAADDIEEIEEVEEDLDDVEYDEDVEDIEEEDEESEAVISDSRARRKRKRGELVEEVSSTDKKNRATPSRRKTNKSAAAQPTGTVQRIVQRTPIVRGLYNYFTSVMAEMRKVTWPSREDTIRLTRMVIAVTIAFSIGLGLLDVFYSWWFRQALVEDTIFLMVAAVVTFIAAIFTWFVFIKQDEPSPF